ncbi:MAG: C40 family peptidase [Oscillospiraceae bacterium]|nr:C40 family peptidase [Oscillospiraceae bacterium]
MRPCKWIIRILCLVLCVILSVPAPLVGAVPAEEVVQQRSAGTMTCAVHNSAYSSSPVIGRLEDGTRLTVLAQRKDFYKIDCYDMTGYIARSQVEQLDGEYYVNCKEGSPEVQTISYMTHGQLLSVRDSLVRNARKHLGTPYVYGGTRPGGFDCSGFTGYLYSKQGVSLNRSAADQLSDGIIVPREGMQVGDLVFFRETGSRKLATHVGLYVGNNQIIHAGNKGISYATLSGEYYGEYFLCARRIVTAGTVEVEQLPAVDLGAGMMRTVQASARRTS